MSLLDESRHARTCIIAAGAWLICSSSTLADVSVFSPASPEARSIRGLFILLFAISALILAIVEGLLIYNIFRFRAGRRQSGDEPPQIYGSAPIEIAWTVGPLLIVFVLFLVVVRVVAQIQSPPAPEGLLQVDVIAHQWWWEFRYPDYDFVTANELNIPAGSSDEPRAVKLTLRSADVVHSFWVPRLAGKTDVFPDRINEMWFTVDEPGTFHGQCAEYCGTQHANMKILVIAKPEQQFMDWVHGQQQPPVSDPSVRVGMGRFMSLACVNCHTIRGTRAQGTVGPDLTHLMSRRTLAARGIENDRENLRRWVAHPQQLKPGCRMPSLHLDESDLNEVVSYLCTLQ